MASILSRFSTNCRHRLCIFVSNLFIEPFMLIDSDLDIIGLLNVFAIELSSSNSMSTSLVSDSIAGDMESRNLKFANFGYADCRARLVAPPIAKFFWAPVDDELIKILDDELDDFCINCRSSVLDDRPSSDCIVIDAVAALDDDAVFITISPNCISL